MVKTSPQNDASQSKGLVPENRQAARRSGRSPFIIFMQKLGHPSLAKEEKPIKIFLVPERKRLQKG
ncbi:hypothetical protein ASF12_19740 [Paenibacillus sp. Leaf72]|nr:hypothetical protein ASF12_19740 [Paenibacillus sp. Leaf72]